jgi:glycosyltransferase involved in cell wall biosynthesis
LRPVVNSRSFGFIYQRLSLANYAGVSLSREQMLPLIIEYNGSEVWVQKNWGRALQFQKTAALAEEVCLKHAHLIVTISDVLRDELISRGVEPDRIVNYPNCIDPGMFNPADHTPAERAQLLSRHNLPHDTCLALFLGTFGQWHGVEVLAAAIRQMAIESPEWMRQQRLHFMLVGDGIKMHEVRQILSDPRCRPFYTLAGLVPQAEAPTYLAAADLLLSPHVPNSDGSKFFGSPTKLFEYMAMGKAILASDLDHIGDVLRHSLSTDALPTTPPLPDETRLAVLAAPGDASAIVHGVRFLAEQPAWREALGKNARREALGKYTWDHHVEAIFERFRGVVREADARPSNLLKAA